MNIKNILTAKFKRDGKKLHYTYLADLTPPDIIKRLTDVVPFEPEENVIVVCFINEYQWYFISDKRVVEQKDDDLFQYYVTDLSEVSSMISSENFINDKIRGLDYIIINLKNGLNHKLNIEKESYSVIDGILSFLITSKNENKW